MKQINESSELLFEKIKGSEITLQIEFAVSFSNPIRNELFKKILEAVTNETTKQNISLIVERIEQAAFKISGYTHSEIEHYQSLFAEHFYSVLHSENYQIYIEDKIRDLYFYCNGVEQDLRTKQYEFLEDKEQNKSQLFEAERYKVYLENLLIHLNSPKPQQVEVKQEQETPVFTNNFDKIKPADIYKHFKAGLVDKGHLTERELNKYLKAAFELKTIPETLFQIKDAPPKEKIYVVFYTYYLNVAGKPHRKQSQYVELLGNYFEGFNNKTIKTNWAKGYNPKKH